MPQERIDRAEEMARAALREGEPGRPRDPRGTVDAVGAERLADGRSATVVEFTRPPAEEGSPWLRGLILRAPSPGVEHQAICSVRAPTREEAGRALDARRDTFAAVQRSLRVSAAAAAAGPR